MKIDTSYNIGDTLVVDGKKYTIVSMHVYQSKECHTERYYLGSGTWITINKNRGAK